MISVTAILRVGSDPEQRDAGGTPVVKFRGASSEKRKDGEVTTWVGCEFWGARAVAVMPYIRKGEKIAVSGTLTQREYDKKDGTKGFSLDLRVQELELLTPKPKGDTATANGSDEPLPF
jgi:single-strand DNA-binding protein